MCFFKLTVGFLNYSCRLQTIKCEILVFLPPIKKNVVEFYISRKKGYGLMVLSTVGLSNNRKKSRNFNCRVIWNRIIISGYILWHRQLNVNSRYIGILVFFAANVNLISTNVWIHNCKTCPYYKKYKKKNDWSLVRGIHFLWQMVFEETKCIVRGLIYMSPIETDESGESHLMTHFVCNINIFCYVGRFSANVFWINKNQTSS